MPPVPQGRNGYFSIGGTKYPCYNVAVQSPKNIIAGVPVSNSWVTCHALGAQSTRVVAQMMLRNATTELLNTTFWNLLMNRTWSGGFDDTTAFAMIVSSGKKTQTVANAKFESASLTVQFGGVIGLTCVFLAPGIPTDADALATDYGNTFDDSAPVVFDQASFTGFSSPVHGFELVYANNHQANAPLNGTKTLTSYDAGVKSCSARITVPEHSIATTPFADGDAAALVIAGDVTRTFSLTSLVSNTPRDKNIGSGQIYQTWDALVKGSASTPPLVVS